VLSVPVGYDMPASAAYYGKLTTTPGAAPETYVSFPTVVARGEEAAPDQLPEHAEEAGPRRDGRGHGPGWDLMYTLTDGGRGRPAHRRLEGRGRRAGHGVRAGGRHRAVEGVRDGRTVGFLIAEPACQTINVSASQSTTTATFFHQTGIIAPPPEM
jgi:hypothetical protein